MSVRSVTAASTAGRLVPLAMLATFALAGCSGGDDEEPAAQPSASEAPGEQVRACRARVAVTGDADSRWRDRAEVSLRNGEDRGAGPGARYTSTDGDTALTLFSAGPDFVPTVTLRVDGRTYSGGQDPAGLDAADDGSGATARLELTGPEGRAVRLDAAFTCAAPDEEA